VKNYRADEITPELLASLRAGDFSNKEIEAILSIAKSLYSAEELEQYPYHTGCIPVEQVLNELEDEWGGFSS
jgi:hypothetical protein